MQFSSLVSSLILFLNLHGSNAFVVAPSAKATSPSSTQMHMSADMNVNRRQAFFHAVSSVFTTASAATIVGTLSPLPANAAKRPEYLEEPTEEFKESERQRMEFRMAQLEIKKKFVVVLDRITKTSKTEDELRSDLEELKALVAESGGLPLGIKKDDVVKQVRSKKAQGFWPTSVEYAYQGVIREIAYQQSPNKDKDIANPL